jgi:hypothetical protein
MNIHEDLMSRNMNNGGWSNKDNLRFGNLKIDNEENLRLDNHNNNINPRFRDPRDESNPNSSIFNLRASNTRKSHNTHGLKENLKEGMKSIESRIMISLKTVLSLLSIISFGQNKRNITINIQDFLTMKSSRN